MLRGQSSIKDASLRCYSSYTSCIISAGSLASVLLSRFDSYILLLLLMWIVLRLNNLVQPMIIVMIAIAGVWNNHVILLNHSLHVVPSIDCIKFTPMIQLLMNMCCRCRSALYLSFIPLLRSGKEQLQQNHLPHHPLRDVYDGSSRKLSWMACQ